MNRFEDVPLPGLDLVAAGESRPISGGRVYDSQLEPTERAIRNFWDNVLVTPDCWIWVGAISEPDGYGRITWRHEGSSRSMSAHRFALTIAGIEVDPGAVAEHRCNEPLCVRVDQSHVITSTQTANLAYAVSLGRAGAHRLPTDGRSRAQRSRDVRASLRVGWDPAAYAAAAGETIPTPTPRLF